MGYIVKRYSVNNGAKVYHPGQTVPGLSEEEAEWLLDQGVIKYGPDEIVIPGEVNEPIGSDDFAALAADEQKELLKSLDIHPASKEEERMKQYAEWLESQVDA